MAPEAVTDYRNENPALRSRKIIGMTLIWGFKATSDPNTFESGQIYNGENGKTYSANISLQAGRKAPFARLCRFADARRNPALDTS